jgi:hypothetical protein
MKTKMRALSAVVGIVILIILGFQNCAKVKVSSVEDTPSQALNVPSSFSSAVVGTSELADLKMLFVVDNSYTMSKNNVNLAQSFPTLFNSQNSDSLARFSVTSGLITVAQRTPAASLSDQTRIKQLTSWQVAPSVTNATQLTSLRQGLSLGKLAGDSIGYSVQNQTDGSFVLEPALVLGVKADGKISGEISKGKSETPSAMVTEFTNRLSLLQNIPVENYQANSDILDNESGLCAVARVLRSPSSFMKAGDLPVFNVFTDEDDSDVDGKNCVASYIYSEENDYRIDGVCETRKTTLNYQTNTTKAASCQISYEDTFTWSLAYTSQAPSSSLTFYKADHYSCPQTMLNYTAATAFQRKKVAVDVTYKTFKVLDGVKVYDAGTQIRKQSFNGDKTTTECQTAAKTLLNTASEEYVSNICDKSLVADTTCTVADATCVVSSSTAKSVAVTGDFTQSCATKISQTDSKNYIAGTGTCTLAKDPVNSSTAVGTSCTAVLKTTADVVTAVAKDLSIQSVCETEAKNRGAILDGSHPATCSTSWSTKNETPKTGSLSLLSWPSVTAAGLTCPTDVKNQVITTAGVSAAVVTGCAISSLHTTTVTPTLTAADCQTQASSYCATQKNGINCRFVSTIQASTTATNQALQADEDLTCTTKCQDSKTGICKPTASLATVNPAMTIADYLTQGYKAISGCVSATTVASGQVSSYNAALESQKASLCAAKTANGLPIYNRVSTAPYHKPGLAPDYVAGNTTAADGSLQPKTDLPTYILQRSKELFGQQLPIVNLFIRTKDDPTGDNGSEGKAYERLATMMNGQFQSVLSPDYSSALKDLAKIINSKITRSFKVPNMTSTQQVVAVSIKAKATGVTRNLASTEWSQSGQTVQVIPTVTLDIGDELQFEFK